MLPFPMLQYVAFPAVLGQLLGKSSCTAARKTSDTLIYMTFKPQAVRLVMTYPEYYILQIDLHCTIRDRKVGLN